MIKIIQDGSYQLIETKGQTKILNLDDKKFFAWVNAADIGEILVTSQNIHKSDCILSIGKYRLYEVNEEPEFADLQHLELFVGNGIWQGYLLPTGLPTKQKKRNRIIPTNEVITKSTH
jgi:hypothetical protein